MYILIYRIAILSWLSFNVSFSDFFLKSKKASVWAAAKRRKGVVGSYGGGGGGYG